MRSIYALACVVLAITGVVPSAYAVPVTHQLNLVLPLDPANPPFFPTNNPSVLSIGAAFQPISLNEGDTVKGTLRFSDDQHVRVFAGLGAEFALVFVGAPGLSNPQLPSPPNLALTIDYSVSFLGAIGDLLTPDVSGTLNIDGGSLLNFVAANYTDSSFFFQGVAFEYTIVEDRTQSDPNAAANTPLPVNFSTANLTFQRASGFAIGAPPLPAPEPAALSLFGVALLSLILLQFLRRQRSRNARSRSRSPSAAAPA